MDAATACDPFVVFRYSSVGEAKCARVLTRSVRDGQHERPFHEDSLSSANLPSCVYGESAAAIAHLARKFVLGNFGVGVGRK